MKTYQDSCLPKLTGQKKEKTDQRRNTDTNHVVKRKPQEVPLLQQTRKKVLWSDETKVELFGLKAKHYLWQTNKTAHLSVHTIPIVKLVRAALCFGGASLQQGQARLSELIGGNLERKSVGVCERLETGAEIPSSSKTTALYIKPGLCLIGLN